MANGEIIDSSQIDLEETFTVEDYPLYWFGEADNKESFNFLTEEFKKSEDSIQREYVFLISSHVHSEAVEFLRNVALGMYPSKTRKQAIFWLGQKDDKAALAFFEEILLKKK